MSNISKITIIGAGLSGSLLAIRLAQRGHSVQVFEKRPDLRKAQHAAGRSINLALSNRGIQALKMVGLEEEMLALSIPMHARMIHTVGNAAVTAPYSGRANEYINSISRQELNKALLNKAETYNNVQFFFHHDCTSVDIENNIASFNANGEIKNITADLIIGTDGAGSALRDSMKKTCDGFQLHVQYLEHGYKELNLPPLADGSFQLAKNVLHIWPRGSFMCIALPNPEGDFTVTLFLAKQAATPSFENLQNVTEVTHFFEQYFPEIYSKIPDLTEQFFHNPIGSLATVKCGPYHFQNKSLLLGDAAHAVVPFYGQGMNCSFEDVVVLDSLIEEYGSDWDTIFKTYTQLRKPNCDAIADLAVDNFYEMRDATANPIFQLKRQLETKLEHTFPEYYSKYSMVTFRADISYESAMIKGRKQDELLMKICANIQSLNDIDLNEVHNQILAIK
jgi:kynurenine 3-monooxygenase